MSAPASPGGDHVTFRVGRQWLGLSVAAVQEVLAAQRLAAVPLAPAAVAGFLNLRGQIVTAVDLRTLLGGPLGGPMTSTPDDVDAGTSSRCDVVVRDGDELFALLVDEVGDVVPVAAADVRPLPSTLSGAWRAACAGALRRPHDVLLVLDLPQLLRVGTEVPA